MAVQSPAKRERDIQMTRDIAPLFSSGGLAPTGSSGMSRGLAKQTKRASDLVVARSEVALTTDTVRAGLTYSALNNVGTLVSAAKSLMDVAPEGAAYYEQVIGAYTIGAASAIARFQ